MVNSLKIVCENLTRVDKVLYTLWCWHICKGEEVRVETDQLGEEKEMKHVTMSDRTLASVGPTHLVSGSSWARSRSSDRTLHGKSDRTRRAYV